MKKILLAILLLPIFNFKSNATHLVGGEFELLHIVENNYQLNLILYFDYINGSPGALDQEVYVNVFSKATNSFVETIALPLTSDEFIEFSTPGSCVEYNDIISTKKFVYSKNITLSEDIYRGTFGYYAVWERCCRNATIDNISSPAFAAQAFYIEFPPVIKNNVAFRNSSPIFSPQVNDFACKNHPFSLNYSAIDEDGDSLVYSLTAPINGFATDDDPAPVVPHPAPYPLVSFLPTYSVDNMIHGDPGLKITEKGVLKLTPTETGLFAIALKCEEFRNGQKIGEVRKEYQLLVIDCHTSPEDLLPPVLTVRKTDGALYQEGDTLVFEVDQLESIDASITLLNENNSNFDLEIEPIDFNRRVFSSELVNKTENTAEYKIRPGFCIDEDEIYNFNLIAKDFQCPDSFYDTLKVTALVKGIDIIKPKAEIKQTNGDKYVEGNILEFEFGVQECVSLNIFNERKSESLSMRIQPISSLGSQFSTSLVSTSETSSSYEICTTFAPNQDEIFNFLVIAEDRICSGISESDTIEVTAHVKGFVNTAPSFEVSEPLVWNSQTEVYETSFVIGDELGFDIQITDNELNDFSVEVKPVSFNIESKEITIGALSGTAPFTIPFNWKSKESDLHATLDSRIFNIDFIISENKFGFGEISQNTIRVNLELFSVLGGLNKVTSHKVLSMYPNPYSPRNGDLHFKFNENNVINSKAKITITDLLGRVVFSENKLINSNELNLPIQDINLKQGIYLVSIEANSGYYLKRLLIK